MGRKKKFLIILLAASTFFILLNYFLRNSTQPVAIVVPHHNVVQEKRLDFFRTIAGKRVKTNSIIIFSPDHFSPNQFKISYSDRNWELSNVNLEFDNNLAHKIVDGLAKENGLVANDHGIYNLFSDIKKVWPEAKVVPLLIGQKLPFGSLTDLISKIRDNCSYDCLLIASVDFSHYLPRALADIHDVESFEALGKLEINSKKSIEVDSAQALYILLNYAHSKQAKTFHFYHHSNSGAIENSRDAETTSHFFGWYQKDFIDYPKKNISTFLVGKDLDIERDQKTLGERFFYGVDYFDGQLNKDFKPSLKIIIEPSENISKVNITDGVLQILLGNDLAIAGYTVSGRSSLAFLPLEKQGFENYLMRGDGKTKFLKDLLQTIDFKDFFVDIKEGIVVI